MWVAKKQNNSVCKCRINQLERWGQNVKEEYSLKSSENVVYSFNLAGMGSRFAAHLIDQLIVGLVAFVLVFALFMGSWAYLGEEWWQSMIVVLVVAGVVLIASGYSVVFETLWNGQTPGKRYMKLRVINQDGSSVKFLAVLIRNVLRIVDYLPSGYAVGALAIFFNRKNQRLGDMAAGTLVVREKVAEAPQQLQFTLGDYPWTPQITANIYLVQERDFSLLRSFLARRETLDVQAVVSMSGRLTTQFAQKLGIEMQDILNHQVFLEQVAAAYSNRQLNS